ncbi:MAG: hypothetical protein GF344_13835 [Chitinivibrionales bacterium]|nr:hypothetical protein [Chitinivibrionales bacterium]
MASKRTVDEAIQWFDTQCNMVAGYIAEAETLIGKLRGRFGKDKSNKTDASWEDLRQIQQLRSAIVQLASFWHIMRDPLSELHIAEIQRSFEKSSNSGDLFTELAACEDFFRHVKSTVALVIAARKHYGSRTSGNISRSPLVKGLGDGH